MAEASLPRPVTVVREVRITLRHRADYLPSKAAFEAGLTIGAPVEHEVVIAEPADWSAIREHLATVPHTVWGRYARTVHAFRSEKVRRGLRIVFRDDVEACMFKLRFF